MAPVTVVVAGVTVVVVATRCRSVTTHAGPQALPERGPLVVVHHDEVELDLLHAGDRPCRLVDPFCQLFHPGPCRHRYGHLYLHPPPTRPHRSHQAEVAQRQADLGVRDRAQGGLDL